MKKWVAVLLSVVMALSLAACGDSGGEEDLKEPTEVSTSSAGTSTSSALAASSAAEGESESDANAESSSASSAASSTVESGETGAAGSLDASIPETVLVDSDSIKITAKSIDYDGLYGPELKLEIENNSDQNLTFQCRNASVNQYMVDTMMSTDVAAGKKANGGLIFQKSSLENVGISAIADMEFSFHVFTTDGWDTWLDSDMLQLKTSIADTYEADTYEYVFDDSGDLAYEGNGVKITVRGLSEDSSIFGPEIMVYIENTGEQDITVQVRDSSINGYMVDGSFSSDVKAGKHCVDGITFSDDDLAENGIDEIQDVELSFHIFNMDNWDTIVDTPPVTMTF